MVFFLKKTFVYRSNAMTNEWKVSRIHFPSTGIWWFCSVYGAGPKVYSTNSWKHLTESIENFQLKIQSTIRKEREMCECRKFILSRSFVIEFKLFVFIYMCICGWIHAIAQVKPQRTIKVHELDAIVRWMHLYNCWRRTITIVNDFRQGKETLQKANRLKQNE